MKYRVFSIVNIFIFTILSCEPEKKLEIDYDCFIKTIDYSVDGNVSRWHIYYYKDEKNIRQEYSNGEIWKFKYNVNGNIEEISRNDNKIVYEYNSSNKIIKQSYYINNTLDYYLICNYNNGNMIESFEIKDNDTIVKTNLYYNNENKLDSVISDNINYFDNYFYYSPEIDSVILKIDNKTGKKCYYKYSNGLKIFEEVHTFDFNETETGYYIKTWEYNDILLVIRETELRENDLGFTEWKDLRTTYNELNNIFKTEIYDIDGNLDVYTNYIYDNNALIKTESFNNQNKLCWYSIYENTCKQ